MTAKTLKKELHTLIDAIPDRALRAFKKEEKWHTFPVMSGEYVEFSRPIGGVC